MQYLDILGKPCDGIALLQFFPSASSECVPLFDHITADHIQAADEFFVGNAILYDLLTVLYLTCGLKRDHHYIPESLHQISVFLFDTLKLSVFEYKPLGSGKKQCL